MLGLSLSCSEYFILFIFSGLRYALISFNVSFISPGFSGFSMPEGASKSLMVVCRAYVKYRDLSRGHERASAYGSG